MLYCMFMHRCVQQRKLKKQTEIAHDIAISAHILHVHEYEYEYAVVFQNKK